MKINRNVASEGFYTWNNLCHASHGVKYHAQGPVDCSCWGESTASVIYILIPDFLSWLAANHHYKIESTIFYRVWLSYFVTNWYHHCMHLKHIGDMFPPKAVHYLLAQLLLTSLLLFFLIIFGEVHVGLLKCCNLTMSTVWEPVILSRLTRLTPENKI